VELCINTTKYMSVPLAFTEDSNPYLTARNKVR